MDDVEAIPPLFVDAGDGLELRVHIRPALQILYAEAYRRLSIRRILYGQQFQALTKRSPFIFLSGQSLSPEWQEEWRGEIALDSRSETS